MKIHEPQTHHLARVSKRQAPEHLASVQLRRVMDEEQLPSGQSWGHRYDVCPVIY